MHVLKIYVSTCTYFKQHLSVGIWTDQIHLQYFETLIFHDAAALKLLGPELQCLLRVKEDLS